MKSGSGSGSAGGCLEISEDDVGERVEERIGYFGQASSETHGAWLVRAVGKREHLGYWIVPIAEDDPITFLEVGDEV